ncbi:hypothetical protein HanIR_Chr05g0253631 [Helianthus annuus]|nr:hypothetical protein HanIR_Chr05g0253631 [Helianthus annuus]
MTFLVFNIQKYIYLICVIHMVFKDITLFYIYSTRVIYKVFKDVIFYCLVDLFNPIIHEFF